MKPPVAATAVTAQPDMLKISWSDGTAGEFASIWLRDNLPEDRDPHSGQRLVDVMDIPSDPHIGSASLTNGTLNVDWINERRRSSFDLAWLYECATGGARGPELQSRLWLEGARLAPRRDFCVLTFDALQSDAERPARLADSATAGWHRLSQRRPTPESCDPRSHRSHRLRAGNQLWPRLRCARGAATGESCVLRSRTWLAHRQSLPRASPGLPGPAYADCRTRWR